ncbi:PH domain-containing protein [Ornithobacterium rhinotracheale]|uniref:PH domain-containing protein n=1 Tax=Ornithobacterium rhinotracheale TaxID=28251 RepID=UPI003FD4FA74
MNVLNLTSGEVLNDYVYKTKAHWISFVVPSIVIFFTFPFFIISALFLRKYINEGFNEIVNIIPIAFYGIISFFLFKYLFKGIYKLIFALKMRIYLSKQYLTLQTGVLSKNLCDIALRKFEGLDLQQSFLGRILNFGTLSVTSSGITQSYLIRDPEGFRNHLLLISSNIK